MKEQGKYDLEGPKNLFDTDQVIEWLVKMCNEHPLLEYLEDPLVEGDPLTYQKVIKRFREGVPRVKIGVKQWFKSNLDTIKHVGDQFIIKITVLCSSLKSYRRMEMTKKKRVLLARENPILLLLVIQHSLQRSLSPS